MQYFDNRQQIPDELNSSRPKQTSQQPRKEIYF